MYLSKLNFTFYFVKNSSAGKRNFPFLAWHFDLRSEQPTDGTINPGFSSGISLGVTSGGKWKLKNCFFDNLSETDQPSASQLIVQQVCVVIVYVTLTKLRQVYHMSRQRIEFQAP